MKTFLGMLAAVALCGCWATMGEDGRMHPAGATVTFGFPDVLPPLVVVEPGVSVVSDLDDEVFYSDGYYWVRQDQRWYRSHDHRGSWTEVDVRYVPGAFARSPPGRYRHYRVQAQPQPEHERERRDEHGGDRR